jgi:hypothetical protein
MVFNKLEKLEEKKYKIKEESFNSGIKINEYIFALASNRNISGGEDKIIFYDTNEKRNIKEIKGYSFTKSNKGLFVALFDIDDNNKILLCACQQYTDGQTKNGILIIDIKDNKKLKENNNFYFYNTEKFEVYCFYQLFKKGNIMVLKSSDEQKNKINYFLAGGFDVNEKGCIKLFKIYKEEDIYKIELIEAKKYFKEPISSILQINNQTIIISYQDKNEHSDIFNMNSFNNYDEIKKHL